MRVLILGGTTEATAIVRALAGDRRFEPVLSLAGRTRAPVVPPVPWRVGGFGGAAGLARYVREEGVAAIVDATHPFAARIKVSVDAAPLPSVHVVRPAWAAKPGDRWVAVADMAAAAKAVGDVPARVFLTVGQGELDVFRGPHFYLVRSVEPPADAPPGAVVVTARGPFREADDRALLRLHGIDTLVTKNSGGTAVVGKLAAARALGVRVIVVARPPPPEGPVVPDAEGALAWLHAQRALRGV